MIPSASLASFLAGAAISLPAFVVALSFHEFCHAWVATLLGDDTPKKSGRLTLNPAAHIDLLGLLFLLIFSVGWASPVRFDSRNFRHPRVYSILTALAGPVSNFLLALVGFYLLHYLPLSALPVALGKTANQLLSACTFVNIVLGVFNLLPVPPLDGSHILMALIERRYPKLAALIYRYSFLFLLLIFLIPQTRVFVWRLSTAIATLLEYLVI